MRWTSGMKLAAVLLGIAPGIQAADSSVYFDSETGLTFSQYNAAYEIGRTISFRIAIPSPVTAGSAYDAVLQIVAPIDVGWTGLAWGGSMLSNPLSLVWQNGNSPLLSSRYTTQRTMPSVYTGATFQAFKTGTKVNGTHYQYTGKCTGCTSFGSTTLNPSGGNAFAFAYSATKPSSPSSASSSITVHDVYAYWTHDFSVAGNANFAAIVAKNLA